VDYLIIGVGNPGKKYENTRHNVAWMVINALSFSSKLIWKDKFKGVYAEYKNGEDRWYFLKPQTFMNLSGESVRPMLDFFKIEINNILVIHDELDLNYGVIAFKNGGGLAGHNGLKSITEHTSTQDYKRLRVGIGRPISLDVSSHVLSPFSSEESYKLDEYLKLTASAVEQMMINGFDKVSNLYNKKQLIEV
jgi:PTH1 family peptidyl-tRNA hydrolase